MAQTYGSGGSSHEEVPVRFQDVAFGLSQSGEGTPVAEVRCLRVLEEENPKLEQLVADPNLNKQVLQDVLRKKPRSLPIGAPGGVSPGRLQRIDALGLR